MQRAYKPVPYCALSSEIKLCPSTTFAQVTGNRWVDMVPLLSGRTANAIKNRFNATLLPRIRQAGRVIAMTEPGMREPRCGVLFGLR
jgi:hypothetical protein